MLSETLRAPYPGAAVPVSTLWCARSAHRPRLPRAFFSSALPASPPRPRQDLKAVLFLPPHILFMLQGWPCLCRTAPEWQVTSRHTCNPSGAASLSFKRDDPHPQFPRQCVGSTHALGLRPSEEFTVGFTVKRGSA